MAKRATLTLTAWFAISLSTAACGQDAPDNLQRFVRCQFGEKVTVEESAERNESFLRPVDAAGRKTVKVIHGFSLHIAYDTTPFVNFKAERLDWSTYQHDKQILFEQLTDLTSTPGMESAKPTQATLNNFDVYGINRKQLEGGVISVYLLFRDADHTVVTLYFLNTPPEDPKISHRRASPQTAR